MMEASGGLALQMLVKQEFPETVSNAFQIRDVLADFLDGLDLVVKELSLQVIAQL